MRPTGSFKYIQYSPHRGFCHVLVASAGSFLALQQADLQGNQVRIIKLHGVGIFRCELDAEIVPSHAGEGSESAPQCWNVVRKCLCSLKESIFSIRLSYDRGKNEIEHASLVTDNHSLVV